MSVRFILFPFLPFYALVIWIRNTLYDYGILASQRHKVRTIVVGNITAGGTGKSPHVEWLLQHLQGSEQLAVLSRGYGRKTKGYHEVLTTSNTGEVGDEPLQIKLKYPSLPVVVCENRNIGIEKILHYYPSTGLILLDDAFQHRALLADSYIVLIDYQSLVQGFWLLPVGELREPLCGLRRATCIIVTKCPKEIDPLLLQPLLAYQKPIFYSSIVYSDTLLAGGQELLFEQLQQKKIGLLTGIAKPQPLVDFITQKGLSVIHHFYYRDHQSFDEAHVHTIIAACRQKGIQALITTEKDYMRLRPFISLIEQGSVTLAYVPIKVEISKEFEDYLKQLL